MDTWIKKVIYATTGLLCFVSFIFIYLGLQSSDLPDFDKCFDVKMHNNKVCPNDLSYTPLEGISEDLINAIIVSEDGAFYDHKGFDWFELEQSFKLNWQKGSYARGGSTITQQLAKNLFLSPSKSVLRKINEAFYTVHLEKNLSKKQILEIYLNVIEFGDGIYGIQAASEYYYQKDPANLNILEAVFLAFLLPSPKKYSESYENGQLTEFARERLMALIERLYRFKKIDEEELFFASDNLDYFPW